MVTHNFAILVTYSLTWVINIPDQALALSTFSDNSMLNILEESSLCHAANYSNVSGSYFDLFICRFGKSYF